MNTRTARLATLVLVLLVPLAPAIRAEIPEPDHTFYGHAFVDGTPLFAGTVTVLDRGFGTAPDNCLQSGTYLETGTVDRETASWVSFQTEDGLFGSMAIAAPGYELTLVNGQVFMEGGEHQGALVGRVIRS